MSSIDLAREWLRAFNARDLDALLALYADDAVHVSPKLREREPATGGRVTGKARLRAWWADSFARLPGLRYEPVSLTGDDARVWMEYRRVLPGSADLMVAEVLVLGAGKIVESRVYHG
ncbi:MAG TPA: nuclear transport factor 2 family protein [Planctomycetota bacterium]|nr:nuclear transport factor 2 family protein [Planctomycetota bacterium]